MVTGTTSVAQPAPVTAASNVTSSERPADSATPPRRASDNRRSNKPIMEKRRRARINNCLNELKALILDAMKKDPARHSKLEKADILEMTVKHLENLQRQQVAMSAAADPSVLNKFRAGFSECAGEVGRFPGLEPAVKRRLLQHLATCLSGATPGGNTATPQQAASTNTATGTVTVPVQPRQEQPTQLQVHILPTATTATATLDTHNIIFSNGAGTGVQLVPTRLPNGDIALVLPTAGHQAALFRQQHQQQQQQQQHQQQQQQQSASPPPMLVPIPTRTASTASASSATSSTSSGLSAPTLGAYSAPSSPEPDVRMLYSPPEQKPLSLVIRKTYQPAEEDKPWRPW